MKLKWQVSGAQFDNFLLPVNKSSNSTTIKIYSIYHMGLEMISFNKCTHYEIMGFLSGQANIGTILKSIIPFQRERAERLKRTAKHIHNNQTQRRRQTDT